MIAFIYNNTRVMYGSDTLVQKDFGGNTIYSANCVSFGSKAEIIDFINKVTSNKIIKIQKIQSAEKIV